MAKKEEIIVVKKIVAGGHAHHGGAWKVAYADFVTAMMCFFLVMWLMGADEDTKAEISHYFNHPNTPWKQGRDPSSVSTRPMGEKQGAGDSILNGADGEVPDQLVQDPTRPINEALSEYNDLKAKIASELDAITYGMDVSLDGMRFSIGEDELFEPDEMRLSDNGMMVLNKIGKVLSRFPGYMTIDAHVDESHQPPRGLSSYEFTMARAVSVMRYLVDRRVMPEEHISPVGVGARKPYTSGSGAVSRDKNNRIEFVLRATQELL